MHIELYDTTLRDGAQGEGVNFSLEDKVMIARRLDEMGFDYVEGDATQWEKEPMERLANEGNLMAYKHTSFWQCMDTLREKHGGVEDPAPEEP